MSGFDVDDETLLSLSGSGPRYTSYPTAPEWSPAFDETAARAAYARAAAVPEAPLAVYVHIPFCERLCLYCGCSVDITHRKDRVERYLGALERELDLVAPLLGERRRVVQLHLGGGTPTHLTSPQMRRVIGALRSRFDFDPGAELSIEVHPHVTSHEQIDTLAELGFRRFSLGVQDLDPAVQAAVKRFQTTEETVDLVAHCRKVGAQSINLDLMYGLPEQTEETFARTLDTVSEMLPDRLAVYAYAHVPWLKPAQKALEVYTMPDPRQRARLFGLALERLSRERYEVVGLDHFALPDDALARGLGDGTLHRNFMGYTTRTAPDMLAFGMSAIGDVGGAFLQNARTTKEYEERVLSGRLAVVRGTLRSHEDNLRAEIILALMCRMTLDLDELGSRFGEPELAQRMAGELERLRPLEARGFCSIEGASVRVLPRGRLFLRHLAMVFDEYLDKKKSEGPRFSQTV
ncbi:MAG TPA: oxygen-independent coproporphyrinogen III oxidase [Planctomycetota bacterium]|nr:oxygen-independent coproporphyrinogen III oxidase [Planctomycetota bacterium]